jgi:hypothetical protein
MGLLKEIVGEAGDLLEQVLIQMGNCVLWEETVIEREVPRAHPRKKTSVQTRVKHYKITLMDVAFLYCGLRLAGLLPPLKEWSTKKPWWEATLNMAMPTVALFNEAVKPDTVPPIPSDATYNPWWGTYTRPVGPGDTEPQAQYRWVESMHRWYAVGDKYYDKATDTWVTVT